jgi:hypothetical protein
MDREHMVEIYNRFNNIVGKEDEVIWQIIGKYARLMEQDKFDYGFFGEYVANLIQENR